LVSLGVAPMETAKNTFRTLVALSIALTIASIVAGNFPGDIPADWVTVLQWDGNGGITQYLVENIPENYWARVVLLFLAFGFFLFVIAVLIGMFRFWRFARFGYVCLVALSVVLVPFDGLVVMAPANAALLQLSLVLDGLIVAMAYLPPIRSQFESDA
jgi:hypothetical protein